MRSRISRQVSETVRESSAPCRIHRRHRDPDAESERDHEDPEVKDQWIVKTKGFSKIQPGKSRHLRCHLPDKASQNDSGKQKEKQRPGTFTLHTVSFLSIAGTAHDHQSRRLFVSPMQEILAYFTPKNNELRKSSHSYSVTIPASTNF